MNIKKKYMKELKNRLPYIGMNEKKSLHTLENEIEQFVSNDTSFDDLVQHFGEPDVLVSYYMEEYNEYDLKKKLKYKKVIIAIISIALLILIIIIIMNYVNSENSYITREKEIITEN